MAVRKSKHMNFQKLAHQRVTLWTVAHQAPVSMKFFKQEYWSGLPSPPPGDLPDPGIELSSLVSPALQTDSLPLSHRGSPRHQPDFSSNPIRAS